MFAALREAARRTGFHLLSSDAAAGTAVFTSAQVMLNFGEKVRARMVEVGPGIVEVTLTSEQGPRIGGPAGSSGAGAELIAETLGGLLPPAG